MFQERGFGDALVSYAAPEDGACKQAVVRLVERFTGQRRVVQLYQQARSQLESSEDIWALAIRSLAIIAVYSADRLAAIPRQGPLVVVANHPFGVVDGLLLCHLISMVRKDFKVVAMSTLCRIPEVRDHVLPINFAETREAVVISARSRAAARALLADGGCLIIFPAGAVSTSRRLFGPAEDGAWHPFVGRLIAGSGAAVVPVCFKGQNSRLFQLASRVSPTIRLSLLMREAAKRMGTNVNIHIRDVLPFEELRLFTDAKALVGHLRAKTYGPGAH